jgi:hypothetical protein
MSFRTHLLTGSLLCLAAGVATACGVLQSDLPSDPPEGLPFAWFHDDCAPWDGPATTLYLGARRGESAFESAFPALRISLYRERLDFGPGRRIVLDPTSDEGYSDYCESADQCIPAAGIVLEISEVQSDLLAGRLKVTFGSRPAIRGGFRATRIPFQALCG